MKDHHLWYPQLCTDLVLILALMFGVSSFGFAQTVDTTAPELIDLGFDPTEIDVSASDQIVTVKGHISEDLSGVGWGSYTTMFVGGISLVSPSFTEPGDGTPVHNIWSTDFFLLPEIFVTVFGNQ